MKNKISVMIISMLLVVALLPGAVFAEANEDAVPAEEILQDRVDDGLLDVPEISLQGNVVYLPDVTAEMSKATFWADKVDNKDEVLVSREEIEAINQAILHGSGTNMTDLKNWSRETYDGESLNARILSSATADAQYFFSVGVKYNDEGKAYGSWDEAYESLFKPMVLNTQDPNAASEMPIKYGICTNRSCLRVLPTDHPLYDDPTDPDFDYLYQTIVRVNEPLVIESTSADGKFYLAISNCTSGWIPVEDVAVCADKEEWLSAWDIPEDQLLVVLDDKIYTEESYYAPETAKKLLPMGTCLELAGQDEWTNRVINRTPYNNYVIWLPVRNDDGTYKKELALIGENRKVSEGYLPLTSANLLSVMMNQLGDIYGWGGMLEANDCSGYSRDVYKCFGIEMARNTSWQAAQPVCKYDLSGLDTEAKAEIIKDLPPGALLIFNGHAMLYLGQDNDNLYVISSVSDLYVDGVWKRVRGGVINTLNVTRRNGSTWLANLHTAEIPYYPQGYVPQFTYETVSGDKQIWTKFDEKNADFTFRRTYNEGAAAKHFTGMTLDGKALNAADYTLTEDPFSISLAAGYLQNLAVGDHMLTVSFDDGNALQANFQVQAKALDKKSVTLEKDSYTYTGKAIKPRVTVKDGSKTLTEGSDYTVKYTDNKAVGTGSVEVTGVGNYTGSVKKTFRIIEKETEPETETKPAPKPVLTGWQKKSGNWYYYNKKGVKMKGWQKVVGQWYYLGTNGVMRTGWQKVSGKWYYLAGNGVMKTGWQKVSGKYYYLAGNGVMQTGWKKVAGQWYYLAGNGVMKTGWQKVSDKWYYLAGNGMMQTGWQKVSGKWYYLADNGVMQTGWQKVSGKWYYLGGNGVMKTGWQKVSGKWYYLADNGVMQTGTRKINGKTYYL